MHANILKYCPNRKFTTIEEHDEFIINAWNSVVKDDDTIFHLGDFAFSVVDDSLPILSRLKGKKVLITGNHDIRHLKNEKFKSHFRAIKYGYHEVEVNFRGHHSLVVMCHYPLETFNKQRYGSFHIHGHCHTPLGETRVRVMARRKDVGVDSRADHAPWEKDELLTLMATDAAKADAPGD